MEWLIGVGSYNVKCTLKYYSLSQCSRCRIDVSGRRAVTVRALGSALKQRCNAESNRTFKRSTYARSTTPGTELRQSPGEISPSAIWELMLLRLPRLKNASDVVEGKT
jgi:hypothetical protein